MLKSINYELYQIASTAFLRCKNLKIFWGLCPRTPADRGPARLLSLKFIETWGILNVWNLGD